MEKINKYQVTLTATVVFKDVLSTTPAGAKLAAMKSLEKELPSRKGRPAAVVYSAKAIRTTL